MKSTTRTPRQSKSDRKPVGPTYTALRSDGKVWYANRPNGNLYGELPLGARPTKWAEGDDPWDGALFELESGRTITVTKDVQ